MSHIDAIVLGAGPAGLSAATALLRGGLEPLVLENSGRIGGSIVTHRENGFLVEGGPNSLMLENDGVEAFFRVLGLVPLEANAAAKKRFLVCGGKPVAAPSGPLSAIATPLLSLRGKLRICLEPFAKPAPKNVDETVGTFVRRRLGAEAATRLVDAMVSGIYAGDIEKLSLRSAFPRLHLMEQTFGSLLKAGLRKRAVAPKRRIVNFDDGMASIPNCMARHLGADRVLTNARITALEKTPDGWTVRWQRDGAAGAATARYLILATPPWSWAKLPLPATLGTLLAPWEKLEAPPLAIVSLGYKREQVTHPLDGFGMLSPGCEDRKVLGVLFQSSLFPNRAPDGHLLLTSFVGGSRRPELAELDAPAQIALVREELRDLVGATGDPVFSHVTKWERAIPQYNVGHAALHDLLETAERDFAGLHFCGNYCAGIALPKTILHALGTAEKILGEGGDASAEKKGEVYGQAA